ncbi:hypothetical protein F4820DRAFT_408555 [Hypoxylon rubiginosum]|uniref:Uncharacterized protein n=1 Tax=Hypoxylon rubiginosum TaxID=110542 RepID=A0ACB9ZBQ7_9PEZI|nr:hypothetical protein F4820DRAFT_408555 [Hypoxylon rubiginosum]
MGYLSNFKDYGKLSYWWSAAPPSGNAVAGMSVGGLVPVILAIPRVSAPAATPTLGTALGMPLWPLIRSSFRTVALQHFSFKLCRIEYRYIPDGRDTRVHVVGAYFIFITTAYVLPSPEKDAACRGVMVHT